MRGVVAGYVGCVLRCERPAFGRGGRAESGPYIKTNEGSGKDGEFGGKRNAAAERNCRGCGVFVGFLVSGSAERGDSWEKASHGNAAGSAASAGANDRGASVCDARFVPAPGNSAFLRAIRREDRGMQLSW